MTKSIPPFRKYRSQKYCIIHRGYSIFVCQPWPSSGDFYVIYKITIGWLRSVLIYSKVKEKLKVKFTLEQAMKSERYE